MKYNTLLKILAVIIIVLVLYVFFDEILVLLGIGGNDPGYGVPELSG